MRMGTSLRMGGFGRLAVNHGRRSIMTKEVFMNMKAEEMGLRKQNASHEKIPVTVLSGFLGTGKTTFLNHLLANQQGMKFGLVVNDMASVNIDAKHILSQTRESSGVDTMELSNGCICCSLSEDLIASISRLMELSSKKGTKYDHVIVECSGIAEPRRIRDFFQQAEDYDLDFAKQAKLDTLITVVDAHSFFTLFGSDSEIKEFKHLAYRPQDRTNIEEDGNAQRKITELLLEQVECADTILINKCDLLFDAKDVQLVEKVISSVNPSAQIVTCTRGQVTNPLSLVGSAHGEGAATLGFLDEHRNLIKAAEIDACTDSECDDPTHHHDHSHSHSHDHSHDHQVHCTSQSCQDPSHHHSHDHTHESTATCSVHECDNPHHAHDHNHSHEHHEATTAQKRFGITSFAYKRRIPFHPVRFSRFLNSMGKSSISGVSGLTLGSSPDSATVDPALQNARRALMRSKGFIWMATSKSAAYFMSHAGQYLELNVLGRWWADIPKNEWPQGVEADIECDFNGPEGDRRQELVFIGQFDKEGGKSIKALEDALDACLLTEEEMKSYTELARKGDNALLDHFAP